MYSPASAVERRFTNPASIRLKYRLEKLARGLVRNVRRAAPATNYSFHVPQPAVTHTPASRWQKLLKWLMRILWDDAVLEAIKAAVEFVSGLVGEMLITRETMSRKWDNKESPHHWVRLFFVEEFLPYSWAFLPADASLQCSFRGDSNQASAYPRLSGGQPSLETVPNTVGLSPSGALPSGHSRGVLVRCRGKGGRPAMAVTTGFQRRTFDVPRTGVPCIDLPSRAPCAAADAVFADAKALLSSSEARQMSESELERELHRRGQDLVRKLLQGHRDQRSPKEAAGPAEDTSGVECSEPREHESHAETASGTMQVVGLGCARRGHDGLHRLDAALNLLPERYLVEMRRRVTIATASRAPPRTPWKPPWYSTSSTWQRRRGVRCSSPAHRRACRHLVRDPMGVDRRAVTLGCSCGGPQPPRAAGALMRTETSHEAREDQRKSPIGR